MTLANGHNGTFTVTIDAPHVADGQYFGQIKLDPQAAGANNVVLPVAFNKGPGDVLFDHSCDSGTVADEATIGCEFTVTNLSNETGHVSARVKGPTSSKLKLSNWSDGNKKGNGFLWNGTLTPALAPEIIALASPGFGFVDISVGFGSLVVGPLADDQAENWTVPGFDFGSETYGELGVVSNGYLVVGGATGSEDVQFEPQDMPNPAAPNNVLAPYWTDLDPTAGGTIYINVLTDGTDDYIVVQWEAVPVFGTAMTRTFQVWLTTNFGPSGESIQFEYETTGAGAPSGLNVGAENRDGSSAADLGMDVVPALTGYNIITGAPTPGGSETITYDVKGKQPGTHKIIGTMTSDVSIGKAKEVVFITVTP